MITLLKIIALLSAMTGSQISFELTPHPYIYLTDKMTAEATLFCTVDSNCMDILTFEDQRDYIADLAANKKELK